MVKNIASEPWERLRPDFEAQTRGAADDSNGISPRQQALSAETARLKLQN
jgi:hypothetical protein